MKVSFNIDDRLVSFGARVWALARHRATHALLGVSILVGAGAVAHATTKKHTFTAGAAALAAHVNENFDDIFEAVTALEDAKQNQTIFLPASTANRDLSISNGGYFFAQPGVDLWGQVAVPLPSGSVITGMTCYVFNDSPISDPTAAFTASLRRSNPGEVVEVAGLNEWPPQDDAIQEIDVSLPSGGIKVEAGQGFFLQYGIDPGDDAEDDDYYPPSDNATARRLLRHYGCGLQYDAP